MSLGDAPRPRPGSVGRFLLRGSAWAFLARMLAVASGFAVQVLLARLLPPAELGAYFLVQSVVAVAAMLAQAGLNRTLIRQIAESLGVGRPGRARGALVKASGLACLLVGAAAGLYALLGGWLGRSVFDSVAMAGAVAAASTWVAAQALQSLVAGAVRGFHRVGTAAMLDGAIAGVLTASMLGCAYLGWSRIEFTSVVWIAAGSCLASVALGTALVVRRVAGIPAEPVPVGVLLRSALPLGITAVAHAALQQGDLWIVGGVLSPDEVALYGAAKRLIRLISLPLVIINLVLPPLVADLHARGERVRLERAIRGVATLTGLPSVAVIALFLVASSDVLGLVYGEFYRQGALLLVLFCVERLVFVWMGPCVTVLIMTGHESAAMRVTLITGALTVLATWTGAVVAGVTGVAVGFLVGSAAQQIWMWSETRWNAGIRTDVGFRDLGTLREALRRALRTQREVPRDAGQGTGPDPDPPE